MEQKIKEYLEDRIPELKDRLFPGFTTQLKKVSVVYQFIPVSGGHLKQSQAELKIIHRDHDYCKEIEARIRDVMDMEEDEPYVVWKDLQFHSQIAGGGCLFNDGCQMWEDTVYFIIDWRNTK